MNRHHFPTRFAAYAVPRMRGDEPHFDEAALAELAPFPACAGMNRIR